MGATLTQQRRVRDEGIRVVNRFQQGRHRRYLQKKPRLTTCQQPRYYVGGERYPDSLGVKRAQAARQAGPLTPGLNPGPGPELARSGAGEESGIPGVAVECADIGKNTDGEGSSLGRHRR